MLNGMKVYSAIKKLLFDFNVNFKDEEYRRFMTELSKILEI